MKSIFVYIKNLVPYLFLITAYFFFVNIEARNTNNSYKSKSNRLDIDSPLDISKEEEKYFRISIPVIPYSK